MTVQELIDKLNSVTNKELKVCFPYEYGIEDGDPIPIEGIFDEGECIMLSESNEYY